MIRLVLTSGACPEQYDAFCDGRPVAHLRLRHGAFTVHCPDVDGDLVFESHPDGYGCFFEDERDYHLRFAVDAIQRWMFGERPVGKRPAPDVEYELLDSP